MFTLNLQSSSVPRSQCSTASSSCVRGMAQPSLCPTRDICFIPCPLMARTLLCPCCPGHHGHMKTSQDWKDSSWLDTHGHLWISSSSPQPSSEQTPPYPHPFFFFQCQEVQKINSRMASYCLTHSCCSMGFHVHTDSLGNPDQPTVSREDISEPVSEVNLLF